MSFLLVLLQSVNILIFGHSYGRDCTEYLPALAVEAGINDVRVGRFIKSNCSLEEHYQAFIGDTTNRYSECLPGETVYKDVPLSIKEVVTGIRWDYIIFQNSLENEGRYETAQPYLSKLVEYVCDTQLNRFDNEPVICWNMFWPISRLHEDGSNERSTYRLSFYENSSEKMWESYLAATRELMEDTGIDFIIPSGTAVMLFRESRWNTPEARELTRDGYHMGYGAGRYLVACTLYEKILAPIYGKSVLGNDLRVKGKPLPVEDRRTARFLQKLAVKAVKNDRL